MYIHTSTHTNAEYVTDLTTAWLIYACVLADSVFKQHVIFYQRLHFVMSACKCLLMILGS